MLTVEPYNIQLTATSQKVIGTQRKAFKNTLSISCLVSYLMATWFRCVYNQNILLEMLFADFAVVSECPIFSQFDGESICIQL